MVDRGVRKPIQATPGSLSAAWEGEARRWVDWVRRPGHDSYWTFHRDRFRELLPPPAGRVLDVGCGEGRLPRDMKSWGYDVLGVDASPTLIRAAREADPAGDYRLADAGELPFADATFALVVAFMSLHDIDDLAGALAEIARVLVDGGVLCMAIVHPINSAGQFESSAPDARFVISDSYLEQRRISDLVERDGLSMTFTSQHRPLQDYFDLLGASGLRVDRLAEVGDPNEPHGAQWRRLPLFMHLRAVMAGRSRTSGRS